MDFTAIDVETANADLASICQIGIATYAEGRLQDSWCSLIDPEDYFDGINVSIHGITESMVRNAPNWRRLLPIISTKLRNRIVVSHTPFDRVAVGRACEKAGSDLWECEWLDSARVVRRTWRQFSKSGYGLSDIAGHLGIEYGAHDALEDARCAGEVMLRAIAQSGLTVQQWLTRVEQPIDPTPCDRRDANPEGELFGEVLVFTGTLSIPRRDAADSAAAAGCQVEAGVNKHTTLLVVGDQDIRKLHGHEISSKQRKAEQLIADGQKLRIIGESDFRRLVLHSSAARA
jgi:DNA polymerase-3 subunit epsilon